MDSKGFNTSLKLLRNVVITQDNDHILVSRTEESVVEFSNPLWGKKIECYSGAFIIMLQVGFFLIEDKKELELFKEKKNDQIDLRINRSNLLKDHKNMGLSSIVTRLFLIGGIGTWLISAILFFTNTESSGYAYVGRTGNVPMKEFNTINWFHAFIIGCFLILMFILTKLYEIFRNKDEKNKSIQ